ncbi:folate transporter 1-like [Homalodisca vitripennis]|uniref:folate transporter 1-like n=1 Tax=Homalodisca vitripennis TaxID=197043 RepID=UPI001EEBD03C|nr:folate transporter 1-like [Homalodisca vitripennis]XP_046669331.1 folate transporter 1-like [Homalodisca vitripennis]XP_046669332.1 folate transporter 1-like [Homalodisca vitripennis]XP_046669333.1 folate transporter 1-like [Homalodisca vitripennis]
MESYLKISVLLCIYGIFKEFRPSEPYLVPIMTEPPLNFTAAQVSQEIFPVSTYSSFIFLVMVFLITDFMRYKVIIILQAICATITYLMIILCRGVFLMQVMQVVYGLYMASEVAYYTYIYAKVERAHYQEVTSFTRSAYLLGRCLSGVASQLAVNYNLTTYEGLLWITVGSEVLALIWAILLPSVDKSMYFHRDTSPEQKSTSENEPDNKSNKCSLVANFLWTDFKSGFTNAYVVKWALWWSLATCGYYLVTSYVQVLWKVIITESGSDTVQYNGAVETIYTILGACASIIMGRVTLNWQFLGEFILGVCSLLMTFLLMTMSMTMNVFVAYITFIALTIIYQTMITVAYSEVAKNVNRDSHGLIFGVTTFAVYLFQSIFTYIALQVYQLEIRVQFEVYALYYGVLGVIFMVMAFVSCKAHLFS